MKRIYSTSRYCVSGFVHHLRLPILSARLLRTRALEEGDETAEKKEERGLFHREHSNWDNKYSRRQEIVQELRDLKTFIESNRNNFVAINEKIRNNVFNFDKNFENGLTTALHDAESMRRSIWMLEKFLNDSEKLLYKTDSNTLSTFDDITKYFVSKLKCNPNSLSMEQMCDILWVFATLGYRPSVLVTPILKKIDKIFLNYNDRLANYYQVSKKFSQEERKRREKQNDYMKMTTSDYNSDNSDTSSNASDDNSDNSNTGKWWQDFEHYGYVPGELQLPMKSNEFSDLMYAFGALRIENNHIIRLFEAMIFEHFMYNNRMLDGFLPKDLSQLCFGYSMYDPAFHFYTITWGINRHLTLLGSHVNWTYSEKLQMLHYDVGMRYINKFWGLQITGHLQKLIDDSFINGMEKIHAPSFNNNILMQQVYEVLRELMLDDQYYCKNVEGYQVGFSRWESRDEPCLIECHGKHDHFMLDYDSDNKYTQGKVLTGQALLRLNCMKALFARMQTVNYYQWPQTKHLQQVFLRKKIYALDAPIPVRQKLLQHGLEPHYAAMHKGVYD